MPPKKTCTNCPHRQTCHQLCPEISGQLDHVVADHQFPFSLDHRPNGLNPHTILDHDRRHDVINFTRAKLDRLKEKLRNQPKTTKRRNIKRYCQIAELRYWQGLSQQQIADQLHISQSYVSQVLSYISHLND